MKILLFLLCFGAWLLPAPAQQLLDRSAFTVGATHRDDAGQDWAYLAWQTNDPASLASATFAVYSKPGDAAAVANYTLRAVVKRQTDPAAINALLDRSVKLGFTLSELEESVNTLFHETLASGNTFTLGQKLSTIFRTAPAGKFQTLLGVGRLHAGFNMALGFGAADPIASGATLTYEVREYDAAAGRDLGVLGRVTVTAGVNTPLPAPGRAWEVRDHPENDDSTFTSRTSLVIPLRWSTPDALRRAGLAHYGFNVWRMTQAYAAANGFDATSPTVTQLLTLAAQPEPPVRRVNHAAVLSNQTFTDLTVDPARRDPMMKFIDDRTILFSDDNGRQRDGTHAFADGDSFYYFITARDILGNDGAVSPPALARACEIIPPNAPDGVKVDVDYHHDAATDTSTQRLKISWKSADYAGRQKIVRYHVYRWSSTNEMVRQGRKPDSTYRIAVVTHVAGPARQEFTDDPPDPTTMVNDQGEVLNAGDDDGDPLTDSGRKNFTWYYTVRAEDDFTCHNFSPHSIAAFGALRERAGPDAPTGQVLARCLGPLVQFVSSTDESYPAGAPEDDTDHFIFECRRLDQSIAWAEFAFFPNDLQDACVTMDPVRVLFPSQEKLVSGRSVEFAEVEVTVPKAWRALALLRPQMAACRVASIDGRETGWVRMNVPGSTLPANGHRLRLLFSATVQDLGYQADCPGLITRPPGRDEVLGVRLDFTLTRGTREWRLHRQCDQGPLTLIRSGLATFNPVNAAANQLKVEDKELPFGVSEVCYWAEVVDRQGNSSRLTRLGCTTVNRPPAPVLAPIFGAGTAAEPAMVLRFFCPVPGVDHFEILINDVPSALPAVKNVRVGPTAMPAVSKAAATAPVTITAILRGTVAETFKVKQRILTGPVGTGEGSIGAGPLFTVTIPKLNPRITQKLVVVAVTRNGLNSARSNGQSFEWHLPAPEPAPTEDPCLPWPARNLPEIMESKEVEPRLEALRCRPEMMPQAGGTIAAADFAKRYPLAIRVGAIPVNFETPAGHYPEGDLFPSLNPTAADIAAAKEEIAFRSAIGGPVLTFDSFLFKVPESKSSTVRVPLFPVVVYRSQVANVDFPSVSGDLVQVTPLLTDIAETRTLAPRIFYIQTLKDPYFMTAFIPPAANTAEELFLLDTQPALRGAAYRYYIVRFGKTGEIDRVIRTNTVTVTP